MNLPFSKKDKKPVQSTIHYVLTEAGCTFKEQLLPHEVRESIENKSEECESVDWMHILTNCKSIGKSSESRDSYVSETVAKIKEINPQRIMFYGIYIPGTLQRIASEFPGKQIYYMPFLTFTKFDAEHYITPISNHNVDDLKNLFRSYNLTIFYKDVRLLEMMFLLLEYSASAEIASMYEIDHFFETSLMFRRSYHDMFDMLYGITKFKEKDVRHRDPTYSLNVARLMQSLSRKKIVADVVEVLEKWTTTTQ